MGDAEMGGLIDSIRLAGIEARQLLFPVMGERLHRGKRRGPGRRAGEFELDEACGKRDEGKPAHGRADSYDNGVLAGKTGGVIRAMCEMHDACNECGVEGVTGGGSKRASREPLRRSRRATGAQWPCGAGK